MDTNLRRSSRSLFLLFFFLSKYGMPLKKRVLDSYSSGSIPNLPSHRILRVIFPSHSFLNSHLDSAYFPFLSCCDLSIPAKYFDWSCIWTIHGTRRELDIPCASSLQETFLSLTSIYTHCTWRSCRSFHSLDNDIHWVTFEALGQTGTLINS